MISMRKNGLTLHLKNTQMRKAYIGLSSPLFYDYGNPATKPHEKQYSSPNPILDGPFGLILFFDELWFLTRSLCPENLRKCEFVFFVDEKDLLDDFVFDPDFDVEDYFDPEQIKSHRSGFSVYDYVLFRKGVHWWGPGARIDNHTHPIISPAFKPEWGLTGNSVDPRRVVFDLAVINHLGHSFEFITNSFTDRLLNSGELASVSPFQFADAMLCIDEIPNYQTPSGPYHECLENLRGNGNLIYFRNWASKASSSTSPAEIFEVKADVEATLRSTSDGILKKYFDKNNEVKSLAKTGFGWLAEFAIPGAGKIYKLADTLAEHRKKEEMRWQGFLLDVKSKN